MSTRTYEALTELVSAGIVRFAAKPPANWRDLDAVPRYTVPLLSKDYPALTAIMWNAAYERFGMPDRNVMVVADPANARPILDTFRRDPKYRGGGCGIGFKEIVIPYLDGVTPDLARAMGAVNIMKKMPDGRLIGSNTDGPGYAQSLAETFARRGGLAWKRVLIIGAGGSARAIAFALAEFGNAVYIANRTEERARELAIRLNHHFNLQRAIRGGGLDLIPKILPDAEVIVAAVDDPTGALDAYSPLGPMMLPATPDRVRDNLEASRALLLTAKPDLIVSDIRIRKEETPLLRQARELGFAAMDGIPMVINQAIEAFWWLYGEELAAQGRTKEHIAAIMQEAAGIA